MVFASLLLGIAFSVNLICGIVFFFILLILSSIYFWKSTNRIAIVVIAITYLVGFIYSGAIIAANTDRQGYTEEGYITGKVVEPTDIDSDGVVNGMIVIGDISYNDRAVKGKARIFLRNKEIDERKIMIGDRLSFWGTLDVIPMHIDSLGSSRLYVDKVWYLGHVNSIDTATPDKLNLRETIVYASRKLLFDRLDAETAGFVQGMMFGDTSLLDSEVKMASRRLGIAHLFAVSGLHVSMLAGFIILILTRLKVKRVFHLFILIPLAFYIYLCNFSVSVLRASIMLVIYLVSKILYMRYDILSSLSLAGIILLLVNPMYLFDLSFEMSFLAVLSLTLFAGTFMKLFTKKSQRFATIKSALSANLAVNIGLLPIMLHLYGVLSLLTFPANVIIIPIISLIFPIFFVLYAVFAICHAYVMIPIIAFPFKLIVMASKWMTGLNFLSINFSISAYFVCAYVIVMLLVSRYFFMPKGVKLVPKILLLIVVLLGIIVPPIRGAVLGQSITASSTRHNYSVLYDNGAGNNILVLMGRIDEYVMENAIDTINKADIGHIDAVVAPTIDEDEAELLSYYNDMLRADTLITHRDVAVSGMLVRDEADSVKVGKYNDTVITINGIDILLVPPDKHNIFDENEDIIVAHSEHIKDAHITPKYYINFAKDSPNGYCTGFTFHVKNGKITSNNIAYSK